MLAASNDNKKLKINFHEVKYGWIEFTLTLGDKSFQTRFSEVFDPIPDLKKWLEAISIGVQQCSFWYDAEGPEIRFNLDRVSYDREIFIVSEAHDSSEIYLSDCVDRHQLVEEFYIGFLSFRDSPSFDKREWEVEYMWERLTEALKIDYDALVEGFLELNRDELKRLLFKADPQYLISYEGVPAEEGFKLYIETTVEGKELPAEVKRVEEPQEWQVPEDYDDWTGERKREFVESCLKEATSGYHGTKIEDFKSNIIAGFLAGK